MREQPSLRPAGFGTRYLEDKERVFEHNAWDNVEWDPEMEEIAQKTIETQKQTPVPSDKAAVLLSEPAKQWDEFYSQHKEKFFMNRNWLLKEFPELDMSPYPEDAKVRVLEVGCGVGNTSIPLAQWDTGKKMQLYSCDYSAVAVELLKSNPEFDSTRCHGFVWDITQPPPEDVEKESLDFVLCIYVLSALHPTKTKQKKTLLLRLCCETLKFKDLFDAIFKEKRLKNELMSISSVKGDQFLLRVLLYELLVGEGLDNASMRYKEPMCKLQELLKMKEAELAERNMGITAIREQTNVMDDVMKAIPRYVRVNTSKWTEEEAIEELKKEEWHVEEVTVDELAEKIRQIKEDQVLIDPHIPGVLIFPNSPTFHTYWMVQQRYLIMQDKASCIPVLVLAPTIGSHCFDTCAAPGNKTSQLAGIIGPNGKVWAMDRSEERVETMRKLLSSGGIGNVSVFCGDFLQTEVTDRKFNKVRYCVVDPPCSGSGMVKRMDDYIGEGKDEARIAKIANLQAMLVKHAMGLPSLRRLVYSTCSLYEEENEMVVQEVLNDRPDWKLCEDVLPAWTCRGRSTYPFGRYCLRADPKETLTNGFFVAVFEKKKEKKEFVKEKPSRKRPAPPVQEEEQEDDVEYSLFP